MGTRAPLPTPLPQSSRKPAETAQKPGSSRTHGSAWRPTQPEDPSGRCTMSVSWEWTRGTGRDREGPGGSGEMQ